jgi:short-subunit dehydrogenase
VTGASTGIGLQLARQCAEHGFDLVIAANEPEIEKAADELRVGSAKVTAVQADLATIDGNETLYRAINGRPVAALLANAGRGLGKGFLDQDFDAIRFVVETNITGTLYLVHKIGRDMRARGEGRILITGSIAGFIPGSYQAVYTAPKRSWTHSLTLCVKN